MSIASLASMWLLQNALHAGKLVAAQPGMTLLDPVVSIIWGAGVPRIHARRHLHSVYRNQRRGDCRERGCVVRIAAGGGRERWLN
jgi:hypothetical protein